jgi:hypothetical protein
MEVDMPTVWITQDDVGIWSLWIDGKVVDRDHDPEHSPLADIFYWAENVTFYERKVHVDSWTMAPTDRDKVKYVALLRGS